MDARERVGLLLEAAREVAQDEGVIDPLVSSTGLSPEGVRLGLSRYLELRPSEEELSKLVLGATPASRVHVILSANVFTAPLRALAVACAASSIVTVKPSRRDPVFTLALVKAAATLGIAIDPARELGALTEGEVHVYGSDETVLAVKRGVDAGVQVRAHGAGLGVAIVSEQASLVDAARGVADDVVVFDQRGCLSPRVVMVLGEDGRAQRFVEALGAQLSALERDVPRGRLEDDERRDAARYVEAMSFAGTVFREEAFAIGLAPERSPLLVPPPGRHVHVAIARDMGAAAAALAPLSNLVCAVGVDEGSPIVAGMKHARLSLLGRMQKPPFDGPVDLR